MLQARGVHGADGLARDRAQIRLEPPSIASVGVSIGAAQLDPALGAAEAEIAWVHAYRRYLWRRYLRLGGGMVLVAMLAVELVSDGPGRTPDAALASAEVGG